MADNTFPTPPTPQPPAPPAGALDKGVTGADPANDLMVEATRLGGPLGAAAIGAMTGAHAASVDYDSLAKDAGAVSSEPDYDALAKQAGAISSSPSSSASTSASTSEPAPDRGMLENLAGGFMKGASKTVQGAANLVGSGIEKLTGMTPGTLQAGRTETEKPSIARDAGEVAENIGEFVMGDEALKSLSMGERLGVAQKIVKLAEDHPVIAKVLDAGMNSLRSGVVGGVQGGVQGAAEGDAAGGATGGFVGGTIGGAVGETASEVAKSLKLGRIFGIGTTASEDAAMGARPGKRNYRFASDFLRSAPYMDAEAATSVPKTVEDWAEATADARNNLYANKIQPLVDRNATVPLGGLNIADNIRAQIPEAMKIYDPDQAAKMESLANDFMPGQKFNLQVQDAEDALQHFNAKLASTGYWSKAPGERAALLKTNGDIAGLKAAGDAIRDELYGKLESLEPGSDVAGLKKDYGALRNVEDEIRGRINVNNRQVPISLKETIGLITGLGHGGPIGAAMAGLPVLDRFSNSPERLIGRAVQKAVRPGEAGAVARGVQAAGRGTKAVLPIAGALIGEAGGTKSPDTGQPISENLPALPEGYSHVRDSAGHEHYIPSEHLSAAQGIDEGLQLIREA